MPRLLTLSFGLRLTSAFLLVSATASAQATGATAEAELIQQLLRRIDRLESRVAELESGKPAAAAAPVVAAAPPVSPPQPAPQVGPAQHDHEAPIQSAASYPSLNVAGFGDINYTASDQHGTHTGFNEGQFVVHISSALSSHVTYFGEISMTARTDAGAGSPPATGFNVEVERSLIRYDQSDHFKLSFGRYHTPIGYWNTQFHHGSWLQTTASRPEMVQFGGSFIPVHFVGALAEGTFSAGGLNLNYNAGIGNGRSTVLSRAGDWGDVNNAKAWIARVSIQPDKLYGLQLGGSVYRDKIDVTGRPQAHEWIDSAFVVWTKEKPEFIAEFFNINHKLPGAATSTNSQGWYAQLAYRLPAERWKPYYRYEYIHTPLADLIYRGLNLDLAGSTLGVRYDISSFAAFKFEWRNQNRPGLPNINLAWGQTSFTF